MPHNLHSIIAPVSIPNDLAPFFGVTGGVSFITHHAVINKWSFFKPFVASGGGFATEEERETAMKAANMGFDIQSFSNPNYFRQHYKDNWQYVIPDGSMFRLCRALDYDGYVDASVVKAEWGTLGVFGNSLDTIFDGHVTVPRSTMEIMRGEHVSFDLYQAIPGLSGRNGLIYPIDFSERAGWKLTECYIGLAFIYSDGAYYITSDTQIGELDVPEIGLDGIALPPFPAGTQNFDIVPIFCSRMQTSLNPLDDNFDGYIITLDGAYLTMMLLEDGARVQVTGGNVDVSGGTAKMELSIDNRTGSPATLSPLFAYILSEEAVDGPDYADIVARVQDYVNDGTIYSEGITVNGRLMARYASLDSVTVAGGDSIRLTFDFGSDRDADGNIYNEYAMVFTCYKIGNDKIII